MKHHTISKPYPGHLIVFEGIDGAGKSTVIAQVKEHLEQNYNVIATQEPGGTDLGKDLTHILATHEKTLDAQAEYLLFATDRAQHIQEVVLPALNAGMIVLSDRMADSSFVYQGYARGVDIAMIETINNWVMGDIRPLCTFYLRISQQEARKRILQRERELSHFEHKKNHYWEKIQEGYETIFHNRDNVITLQAEEHLSTITNTVVRYIIEEMNDH